MLCLFENGALQRVAHMCIQVSGDGYVWSGFNSFEMLSITCRTTSIKCSNDGQLTPKICLHFRGVFCILENSALQNVAYLFIHVSMDDMTGQGSIVEYTSWAAHAELRTWLRRTVPSCVSLLQPHLPNASIMSSECSNSREFYPPISLQTFQGVFAGRKCSYIFSTSM